MGKIYDEFVNVVKKNVKDLESKGYINSDNIDDIHKRLENFIVNHKDNSDAELNKIINMIKIMQRIISFTQFY